MTSSTQPEPEPQWQQPDFLPGQEPDPTPDSGVVASGPVIVPAEPTPPPSVVETTLRTVTGIIWPVMIVLALLGRMDWWVAIVVAIAASTVLGNISGHLRAQRKAVSRPRRIPPGAIDPR